ncbi:unnamed protein product [Heterobilharzia americana]|nr:unnamed protein product [Heterobilharzia americana]
MTIDYTARKLFDKFNIDTKQWSYSRLTVAVLAHESLGVGLLVGFWVICYKKQPLKYLTLLTPVSIQGIYSKIKLVSTKTSSTTVAPFFANRS